MRVKRFIGYTLLISVLVGILAIQAFFITSLMSKVELVEGAAYNSDMRILQVIVDNNQYFKARNQAVDQQIIRMVQQIDEIELSNRMLQGDVADLEKQMEDK